MYNIFKGQKNKTNVVQYGITRIKYYKIKLFSKSKSEFSIAIIKDSVVLANEGVTENP